MAEYAAIALNGITPCVRQVSWEGNVLENPLEAVREDRTVLAPMIGIIGGERIYSHTGETITSSIVVNGITEIQGPRKWPMEIAWKRAGLER